MAVGAPPLANKRGAQGEGGGRTGLDIHMFHSGSNGARSLTKNATLNCTRNVNIVVLFVHLICIRSAGPKQFVRKFPSQSKKRWWFWARTLFLSATLPAIRLPRCCGVVWTLLFQLVGHEPLKIDPD